MIILFDNNKKQYKYKYVSPRDYRKIEDTFLINTLVALDYLYENDFLSIDYDKINKYADEHLGEDKVNILDKLIYDAKEPIYLRKHTKNMYAHKANTIGFNDTQGASFRKHYKKRFTSDNKGQNSPLALLTHELIHCYHELFDTPNYHHRRDNHSTKGRKIVASGSDLSYPNQEEELVILLTNQVLKKMGEDIRGNYGRNYYDVDNVLSTKKPVV